MENDYELLYLAKENNEEAINILYNKYKKILKIKVKKHTTDNRYFEDFMNIANLTFYNAINNYRDQNNFSTYLNTCLEYSLLNYYKSITTQKNRLLNDSIAVDDNGVSILSDKYNPEKKLIDIMDVNELKNKIVKSLTWKEELVFILKLQNYTPKEISQITDNNLKTVYSIIKRMQKKIVKLMS